MTRLAITTFEGWERHVVAGVTGNVADGAAKYFEYDTAFPTKELVARFDAWLGLVDSRRLLKVVYAQLKIQNRPNPLAKAPKHVKADVALSRQLELAQKYIANGEDPMTAFRRAASEALKVEPAVDVKWITKELAKEHDDVEQALLADRLG